MFAKCVSKQCKVVQLQCHLSRVLFVLSPLSFPHQNFVLKGTIENGEKCVGEGTEQSFKTLFARRTCWGVGVSKLLKKSAVGVQHIQQNQWLRGLGVGVLLDILGGGGYAACFINPLLYFRWKKEVFRSILNVLIKVLFLKKTFPSFQRTLYTPFVWWQQILVFIFML